MILGGGKAGALVFFFTLLLPLTIASCSSDTPSVSGCDVRVVFDFSEQSAFAAQRLSVFLHVNKQGLCADKMTVSHNESGLFWQTDEPYAITSYDKAWVGKANFSPPPGMSVPKGDYTAVCKTKGGDDITERFSVAYPEGIEDADAFGAKLILGDGAKKMTAVYDKSGVLLYYGVKKKAWQTAHDAARDFKEAAFVRETYERAFSDSCIAVCLMPIEEI